jgi:hypothetical protein
LMVIFPQKPTISRMKNESNLVEKLIQMRTWQADLGRPLNAPGDACAKRVNRMTRAWRWLRMVIRRAIG